MERGFSMSFEIADGVWPTMLTPFDEAGEVDFPALEELVGWYIENGAAGLFAVCQSSEMFALSLEERTRIAAFVVKRAAGRCGVIASGHVSDLAEEQVAELRAMAECGVDAVVLVTNRMAARDEEDEQWKRRTAHLLEHIEIPLGLYECPYPYKRLLSEELISWAAATERFHFLKDTCCDRELQAKRIAVTRGGRLKLYNAHSASLLHSLQLGYAGFSGIMANFHPDLYVRLHALYKKRPELAGALQTELGIAALIEEHGYPANAKHFLQRSGLRLQPFTRVREDKLPDAWHAELEELMELTEMLRRRAAAEK